jgi:aminopeptidase N
MSKRLPDLAKSTALLAGVGPALLVAALILSAPGCGSKVIGTAGLGDSYFPLAGNGGYDVTHYSLELTVSPSDGAITGNAGVTARATQELDRFDLDLMGLEVQSVALGANPARFSRDGQELQIECPARIHAGQTFTVSVAYAGVPAAFVDHSGFRIGWQSNSGNVFVVDEPNGAMTWFPCNDHPRDKATYSFRITVPKPFTAAANGVLTATEDQGDRRTFVWEMRQPMASYLAAVNVGSYDLDDPGQAGPAGTRAAAGQPGTSGPVTGVPIRSYVAPDLRESEAKLFSTLPEQMTFFAGVFGPYPFEEYGVVVSDADTQGAMENQTLSLYGKDVVAKMADPTAGEIYSSHELAHQWVGDSVTLADWRDIWLNEGFATYASWLWLEHSRGAAALADQVQRNYGVVASNGGPPPGDPLPDKMFGSSVYLRGALTLHALRLTLGDAVFFRILREWASRFQYKNVSTSDFEALVRDVSGKDLSEFFRAWLDGSSVPALPSAH